MGTIVTAVICRIPLPFPKCLRDTDRPVAVALGRGTPSAFVYSVNRRSLPRSLDFLVVITSLVVIGRNRRYGINPANLCYSDWCCRMSSPEHAKEEPVAGIELLDGLYGYAPGLTQNRTDAVGLLLRKRSLGMAETGAIE
jgi:hypothetical protein